MIMAQKYTTNKKFTILLQFSWDFSNFTYPWARYFDQVWWGSEWNCGFFITCIFFGQGIFLLISLHVCDVLTLVTLIFVFSDLNITDCSKLEGFGDGSISKEAYISAIIIGLVRLLASLLLSRLLREYCRRSMYFASAALTITSLACFAACIVCINR